MMMCNRPSSHVRPSGKANTGNKDIRMLDSVGIMVTSKKGSGLSRSFQKLLAGKNFINLATIISDGTPQVTPTWVDTDGEYVLINTGLGRTKTGNVERDPRVAAAISPLKNPYTYTLLREGSSSR